MHPSDRPRPANERHGATSRETALKVQATTCHTPSERLAPDLLRFSTDAVDQASRLDYWIGAVSETLGSVTASSPEKRDFRCELIIGALDSLHVVHASGSQQESFRTRRSLSGDVDHTFHLMADFGSAWTLRWRGVDVRLAPGDLIFTDSRYLHSGHYPRNCTVTNIKLPPAWTQAWLLHPERLAGRRIERDRGWGRALSHFVSKMTPHLGVQAPLPPKAIADHLGSLMSLVEAELSGRIERHERAERQTLELAHDIIRQRAGDPGLTSADIAESLGMPSFALHQSLEGAGETFGGVLQRRRLEIAKGMLESRHFKRLTTAEIGRRAGFSDPSYFVRMATRYLGLTPARYRSTRRP